jgi:hypothetical protein
MESELIATNAERIVSITREATRNFGIFSCFLLLLLFFLSRRDGDAEYCVGGRDGGDDNSAAAFRLDDDDLELICDVDDDFIDLPAEANAGYPAIAIANITLRYILPANHVCGIKYFRNRNSSIKV